MGGHTAEGDAGRTGRGRLSGLVAGQAVPRRGAGARVTRRRGPRTTAGQRPTGTCGEEGGDVY